MPTAYTTTTPNTYTTWLNSPTIAVDTDESIGTGWSNISASPALNLYTEDKIEEEVQKHMEFIARKIYNLVKEVVKLNVTEDEFIELLKEE